MKIRVHMPTRSRPTRALRVIESFQRLASRHRTIEIAYSVVIDEDDPTMNNPETRRSLGLKGVKVHTGTHRTKVEACNSSIERDCDILLLASDDMTPVQAGWDLAVMQAMIDHFPNFDGALHFNDGHTGEALCTFPIMGINLFKKFGHVYHPEYKSLWCDNEFTDLLRAMRRLPYINRVLFRHDHFSFGSIVPFDKLYERNEGLRAVDEVVYRRREAIRDPGSALPFGWPAIRLSLLVASLKKRTEQLRHLLAALNDQINGDAALLRGVEIIVRRDEGAMPIGLKRQELLKQAIGSHIAFIDDDDAVAPDYVARVVKLITADPEVGCIGINGEMTTDGGNPRRFTHSLQYDGWYEREGVYYRTPNHLNPVRRDFALAAGFGDERHGEDKAYSDRVTGILRAAKARESMIDPVMYHYRFSSKK